MSKEAPISSNERQFIVEGMKHDIRVDGRTPLDMRMVKISFGEVTGTAEIQLGKTRALACVTADLVAPFPDRPAEGMLNFFIGFSPMASTAFQTRAGGASDKAIELSRVVERAIKESRAIDTEALCVVAGEKVWAIRCDVHVTDHDGNLMDCVNLAAVTALLHFRRPDVAVVGDKVTVYSMDDRQPVPLAVHHTPISLSFALFNIDNQERVLLDPGLKEEAASQGFFTITLNKHRELACLQKAGGIAIGFDLILKCAHVAAVKAVELTALIEKRLKEDEDTTRSAIKLAGLDGYKHKAPQRVGEGKDALGNPLDSAAAALAAAKLEDQEDGELMDDDE